MLELEIGKSYLTRNGLYVGKVVGEYDQGTYDFKADFKVKVTKINGDAVDEHTNAYIKNGYVFPTRKCSMDLIKEIS